MKENEKELNKFLKEGSEWFSKNHLPQYFPATIANISLSINELSKALTEQAESNKNLSKSINYATWFSGIIAFIVFIYTVYSQFFNLV